MANPTLVSSGFPGTPFRLHPNGDLSAAQVQDEIKGWLQFIAEEWVSDQENEFQQRYNLMERWAAADQSFRDSHYRRAASQRAPIPPIFSQLELTINRFVCLAPIHRETHPRNYTRLVKILILLYLDQDGCGGHPFRGENAGESSTPQLPTRVDNPSPQYDGGLAPEDLLSALFLSTADFRVMAMTQTGTVLFLLNQYDLRRLWFVLDQSGLDTGLLTVLQFKPNGQLRGSGLRRPFNLGEVLTFHYGHGYPIEEINDSCIGGRPHLNTPLDIDLPILDMLEITNLRGEFRFANWGNRESWTRDIERCAPGYLDLEGQGRAVEFDLENLEQLPEDV